LAGCALASLPPVRAAAAQAIPGRSADYLFAAAVSDARAIWVNPAGLAAVPEASVMVEGTVSHDPGDWRLGQYAVGLNSRGFALSYQKDRLTGLLSGSTNTTIRIGTALPLRRGAIGAVVTFHNAGVSNRSLDVGGRFSPVRPLNLGVVLRNIGRPRVRAANTPLVGVGSASLDLKPGMAVLLAEARATERLVTSGWDLSYHAGARLSLGLKLPFTALGLVDLDDGFHASRWTLGISVGGLVQGVVVGSVVPGGSPDFRQLSLTALSRRPIGGTRRGDEF
jgi:hypothetical protein